MTYFKDRSHLVGFAELNRTYQRLRRELDAAYAGPEWNTSKIDRLAEQIVQVEFALASAQHRRAARSPSAFASAPSANRGA